MTREEPKYCDRSICLKNEYNNVVCENCEVTKSQEPTTKNDLGVDCISREQAKAAIRDKFKDLPSRVEINTILNELPPVTPIRPKGHWITKDGKEQGYDIGGVKTWYIQIMCSECGFIKTAIEGHTGQYHYCPNCGCHMVKPQESEVEE